ncbi:hypothetical protein EpCFBP13511_09760 [Erwinia persicina]|uniref:GYF domain-containing protein n=2 Tax=Erwinia persicina TaxID=55211 RepID=A0A4U3FD32_9GAMM|nr:hypothetical protein EpCFBP13511_09760 [Erwinia persicina]
MAWHYENNVVRHDNVTEDDITSLIVHGELTAATLVWRQGMTEWQPVSVTPLASMLLQSAIHQRTPTAPDTSKGFIRSLIMERKSSSVSVKWGWLALSVALMAPTAALAAGKTAVEARNCQPGNNTCPYPFDLYKTDEAYKKSFDEAMNQNGLPTMLDEMNGPAGPMEPVKIDGKVYLKGFMCEEGNCGNHNLTFLYQPELQNFVGFYSNSKEGQWINTPSDGELKALRALVKGTAEPTQTPVATTLSSDVPPPDTIWEFIRGNGDTMWKMCGGKQSTCTIVANTKYYVAVMNHKSANRCAFGDLYLVDRSTRVWTKADSVTCSPNAWIRKGSIKGGQYLSVDIGIGDTIVKQYPIGYWSAQKEFSGPNRPSWDKAKQNRQQ